MGALAPEVASPPGVGSKPLCKPNVTIPRCRKPTRNLIGRLQTSSTPTATASNAFSRGIAGPAAGLPRNKDTVIARSSAAASFDAVPDDSMSGPSTAGDMAGEVSNTHSTCRMYTRLRTCKCKQQADF